MSIAYTGVHDTTLIKNLWCRDARAKFVINLLGFNPFYQSKGCHVRECTFGETCRGAHNASDIKLLPHISRWNRYDKKNIDFPHMEVHIKFIINKDKTKLKLKLINPFNEKINKIEDFNIIEIVQLWRELACYYRKISKEIPRKCDWKSSVPPKTHESGYVFSDDVPGFYLDEKIEDNAWTFDRITRWCNIHQEFKNKIARKEKVIIWDMCLGETNCKEGVHFINEYLCYDNFLTGKCDCISLNEFDRIKIAIQDEIEIIEEKLKENFKPKQIEQQKALLAKKKKDLVNHQRKLHFTESGMKPYIEQLSDYKKKLEDEKAKKEELLSKVIKPSWDNNTETITTGKVIKLSLKK